MTSTNQAILRGFSDLEGETLGVFLAGLDCGDFPVIGGVITVPLNDPAVANGLLTERYLDQVSALGRDWGLNTVILDGGDWNVPCVVGYRYKSRGQTLPPVVAADAGAANGPAFGKLKRNHKIAALLQGAAGVRFGQDFDSMSKANFKTPGGARALSPTELFSGVFVDSLPGASNREGMLAWEVTGPYSCQVTAIGGLLKTEDE